MNNLTRQKGVAIITALLIVAIATTVSVTISTRLQLDVRRTGNIISSDQAYLYALAAENWSRRILSKDREDSEIDHLGEDWAFELPAIPVEGGSIKGKLTDLQACINLNSLHGGPQDTAAAVARARFERLMTNLKIDSTVSQSVIDWIDSDLETTIPDGAEDGHYMSLEKPYRTANAPMHSVSELRLVKGFEDPAVYDVVLPYVCAFDVNTPVNVNTAAAEVLRSLGDGFSESDIESIIEQRTDNAFSSIDEFEAFKDNKKKIPNSEGLSVNTDYFMLQTESTIGQVRVITYSVIERADDGSTRVLTRSQGVY